MVAVVGYEPTPSKRLAPQTLALAFVCVKILTNVTLSFEENSFHMGYAMFLPGFEEKRDKFDIYKHDRRWFINVYFLIKFLSEHWNKC